MRAESTIRGTNPAGRMVRSFQPIARMRARNNEKRTGSRERHLHSSFRAGAHEGSSWWWTHGRPAKDAPGSGGRPATPSGAERTPSDGRSAALGSAKALSRSLSLLCVCVCVCVPLSRSPLSPPHSVPPFLSSQSRPITCPSVDASAHVCACLFVCVYFLFTRLLVHIRLPARVPVHKR
jgi:hypothetical protein